MDGRDSYPAISDHLSSSGRESTAPAWARRIESYLVRHRRRFIYLQAPLLVLLLIVIAAPLLFPGAFTNEPFRHAVGTRGVSEEGPDEQLGGMNGAGYREELEGPLNAVRQLREKTGAGMMQCWRAVAEARGDFVKAEEVLRKKGLWSTSKKVSRAATLGGHVVLALIWTVWFPLVFASVFVAGRIWCGVLCPMGAAAEWATRVGCNWSAPRFLRWSGLPVLSLFLATLVGHSIDVDGSIAATAEIYGALLAVALITGLLLERGRRAWCRLLCPIGSLLGVFSRLGAVQFAYPDRKIGLPDAYSTAGVCPTMIDTARKSESRHCIECFKCVNPEAKGSIRLQLRSPGDEVRAIDGHSPSWSEVLLVFAGTGTILGALVRGQVRLGQIRSAPMVRWVAEPSWSWLARPGPSWLTGAHPWAVFFSCLICMLAGAFLYAFLLAPMSALSSWLASRRTGPASRRQLFQLLGYQFFPVAALSVLSGLSRPLQDLLNSALPPLRLGTACGVVLILVGIAWSLHTGERILRRAGIAPSQRWLALLPGLLGSALAGFAWWPVVIG